MHLKYPDLTESLAVYKCSLISKTPERVQCIFGITPGNASGSVAFMLSGMLSAAEAKSKHRSLPLQNLG